MKDRFFYHLNENREIVYNDLEDMHKRNENAESSYMIMYKEMFECFMYTESGCDYERLGCQIKENDIVVDIGGNIGVFARHAWEKGAKQIFSFEPQRNAFICNYRNAKENIHAFNFALSDKVSTVQIGCDTITTFENSGGYQMSENIEVATIFSEKAITLTLDSLFQIGLLNNVDFLKIDVEGAELHVFRGISDENLKKFRCISFELHRKCISDEDTDLLLKRIDDLGYQRFTMYYPYLTIYNFWRQ